MKTGFYFDKDTFTTLFINVMDETDADLTILKDQTSYRASIQDIKLCHPNLSVIAKNSRYTENRFIINGSAKELLKKFQTLRKEGLVRDILIKEDKYFKVSLEGLFPYISFHVRDKETTTVKISGIPNKIAENILKF